MTDALARGARPKVLVTGAGTRLGFAIAENLLAHDHDVVAHFRSSQAGIEELQRRFGARVFPVQADLTDKDAAEKIVSAHSFTHLVLSAGIFGRTDFDSVAEGDLLRFMQANVFAHVPLVQRTRAQLAAHNGSIVLLTCTSAEQPYKNFLPYVLSKAATRQLMRSLALELAPEIRVNAIAPGTVLPPPEMGVEEQRELAEKTLLQRLGSAQDVADAVLFLLRATFMTGQELVVDGGATLRGNPIGEG